MYNYRAKVVDVYDGDTIRVDIDLGFGVVLNNQPVRLYGIDTPEVRGPERHEGQRSAAYLNHLLARANMEIELKTHQAKKGTDAKGKYGRWLAEIIIDGMNVNQHLIERGYGVPYEY